MDAMTDEFLEDISETRIAKVADDFIKTASNQRSALEAVVGLLYASVPYYNWVGIYLLDENDVLKLGPYRGNPSPHREIPLSQGICGAAARAKRTIIVPDVSIDPRYLTCSEKTKSEIVVPIMAGDQVKGEIDIDSDKLDAFRDGDQKMLETIAARLGEMF
jgi:GAF domain-containing protein